MPGPPGYPFLGNVLNLIVSQEELWQVLCNWQNQYSPIYKFWLSFVPFVIIRHPDYIQMILGNTKKTFEKSEIYKLFQPAIGTSVFTSKGNKANERRTMIHPVFNSNRLNHYAEILIEEANYMTKSLTEKDGIIIKDLLAFITEHTLNAVYKAVTGDSRNLDFQEYRNAMHDVTELIIYRLFRPWFFIDFLFSLSPQGRKQKKILKILHAFIEEIIAERKLNRINNQVLDNLENAENSDIKTKKEKKLFLLDLLIENFEKGLLNDIDIRNEVITFMFAGYDTTANTLTFALLLLAEHEDVQERVRQEVNTVLEECAGKLTRKSLENLFLLDRCIKETLRMYPPAYLIFRKSMKDVKLQSYVIPAETTIGINIYGIHRDPNLWPNPDEFKPERFLEKTKKDEKRDIYRYVPFSAGTRSCMGQKFARIQLKIFMAILIHKFYLKPVTRLRDIRIKPDIIIHPSDAVSIKFIPIT